MNQYKNKQIKIKTAKSEDEQTLDEMLEGVMDPNDSVEQQFRSAAASIKKWGNYLAVLEERLSERKRKNPEFDEFIDMSDLKYPGAYISDQEKEAMAFKEISPLIKANKLTAAIESIAVSLSNLPTSQALNLELASVLMKQGRYSDANLAFETLLKYHFNLKSAIPYVPLLRLLKQEKRGIEIFHQLTKSFPNSALAFRYLGYFYTQRGGFTEAIGAFLRAIQLANHNLLSLIVESEEEIQLLNFSDAFIEASNFISKIHDDKRIVDYVDRQNTTLKSYLNAQLASLHIQAIFSLLMLNEPLSRCLPHLSWTLHLSRETLERNLELISKTPSVTHTYHGLTFLYLAYGLLYEACGDLSQAADYYRGCLERDPYNSFVLFRLRSCVRKQDETGISKRYRYHVDYYNELYISPFYGVPDYQDDDPQSESKNQTLETEKQTLETENEDLETEEEIETLKKEIESQIERETQSSSTGFISKSSKKETEDSETIEKDANSNTFGRVFEIRSSEKATREKEDEREKAKKSEEDKGQDELVDEVD